MLPDGGRWCEVLALAAFERAAAGAARSRTASEILAASRIQRMSILIRAPSLPASPPIGSRAIPAKLGGPMTRLSPLHLVLVGALLSS